MPSHGRRCSEPRDSLRSMPLTPSRTSCPFRFWPIFIQTKAIQADRPQCVDCITIVSEMRFGTLDALKHLKYSVNVHQRRIFNSGELHSMLDVECSALKNYHTASHFSSQECFLVSHRRIPPRNAFSFCPRSVPSGKRLKRCTRPPPRTT
jgi:hypothetical protein